MDYSFAQSDLHIFLVESQKQSQSKEERKQLHQKMFKNLNTFLCDDDFSSTLWYTNFTFSLAITKNSFHLESVCFLI